MSARIVVRGRIARRIREEAERLGLTPDKYLLELLSQGLGLMLYYLQAPSVYGIILADTVT